VSDSGIVGLLIFGRVLICGLGVSVLTVTAVIDIINYLLHIAYCC
jgi:hypothetical protein